jgi:GNAT superfamily N-acetyltransferase
MELRAAEPEDIPALAELLLRASPGRSIAHEVTYVRGYFDRPETVVTVAVDSGRLVGVVSFEPSLLRGEEVADERTAYLRLIALDPLLWGGDLATQMLSWACARMRQAGFGSAYLWCGEQNGRARRFYEREGWQLGSRRRSHPDWGPMVEYTVALGG